MNPRTATGANLYAAWGLPRCMFNLARDCSLHPLTLQPRQILQPKSSFMATTRIALNCLVLGDPIDRFFTVEVPARKNISALRDSIKEKNKIALQHVDAKSLTLWKASLSVDDDFEEQVGKIIDGRSLSPVTELSSLFSGWGTPARSR